MTRFKDTKDKNSAAKKTKGVRVKIKRIKRRDGKELFLRLVPVDLSKLNIDKQPTDPTIQKRGYKFFVLYTPASAYTAIEADNIQQAATVCKMLFKNSWTRIGKDAAITYGHDYLTLKEFQCLISAIEDN